MNKSSTEKEGGHEESHVGSLSSLVGLAYRCRGTMDSLSNNMFPFCFARRTTGFFSNSNVPSPRE